MVVPAVIFVVCFLGGVLAATQWLPGIAEGQVGAVAFFAVCGLLGAGLGIVGLHVYLIVRALEDSGRVLGEGDVLASGLETMLEDAGTVFGLATIAYLLAPREAREHEDAGVAIGRATMTAA